MKRKSLIKVCALFLGCLSLAGCSSSSSDKKQLDAPTQFTFDFDTSEYSFSGVKNAKFYNIKVFQYDESGTELGGQAVASSGMIKATDENDAYTGTIDYSFTPGKYKAEIKCLAPKYKVSEVASCEGNNTSLLAPTVSATFGSEGDATIINITITASDTITQSYTVNLLNAESTAVYTNASATAGSLKLTASDLTGVESIADTDTYTVSVINNAVEGYKVPASAATATVKKQQSNNPGGPGATQSSDLSGTRTWKVSDETFDFYAGTGYTVVATKAKTVTEGSSYSYTLSDGNAIKGTFELKTDNTLGGSISGGPLNNTFSGTWSLDGDTLTAVVSK